MTIMPRTCGARDRPKALWCSGRNFIVNAYGRRAIPVRFIQHLVARVARTARAREGIIFFFILTSVSRRGSRTNPEGGVEAFRNSDDRSLVSHATHQLNVNVCLYVWRESQTFTDVRALSSRHRCAPLSRCNNIAEERLRERVSRCALRCSAWIVIRTSSSLLPRERNTFAKIVIFLRERLINSFIS